MRDARSAPRPCRRWGSLTRSRTSRTCASATARTAGPETPPVSAAEPRLARSRAGPAPCRARVLMSETASAPWRSAAAATAAGDAQLGVSFTISGLAVRGRTASSSAAVSPGSAPISSPVLTFGHETLSSIAATSARAATAATSSPTSASARAHDVDDQRHRERRELGQVLGQEALEPLVGQPDRVDHAGAQLPQPGRRVALARGERDRLGDERGEREALEQRLAERAPGGDRVERSGAR